MIGLLWFKRQLPDYVARFIELVLQIVGDHGPAVSGAHNAIVAFCAGKDLISSLCSGLLTIGQRFGGAIDDAAMKFKHAHEAGLSPEQFIADMKKKGINILGIGHKIKSTKNPDKRVQQLMSFARARLGARRRHLPIVAGSDSHFEATVGLGVTDIQASDAEDAVAAIRAGRSRNLQKTY